MAITIDQGQRDAIWADIKLNHTAISDVECAFVHGDDEYARELRERFKQHWRLLDDLGWARADVRNEFTLTMSPAELADAMRWHRDRGAGSLESNRDELKATQEDMVPGVGIEGFRAGTRQDIDECLDLISACDRVLDQVGS